MSGAYVFLAVYAAIGFYLVRSAWAYRARTAILYADYTAYQTLPSYEAMIWWFWIWDAAKFLNWPVTQEMKEEQKRARYAAIGRRILRKGPRA